MGPGGPLRRRFTRHRVLVIVCVLQIVLTGAAVSASWSGPPKSAVSDSLAGSVDATSPTGNGPLVARVVFPNGTVLGYGLYDEVTDRLNAAPLNLSLAASVTGGIPPYSYRWDFGDSSPTSTSPVVVHVYQYPGYYILHLTVTDAGGNESVAWAGFSVYPDSGLQSQNSPYPYHVMISTGLTMGFAPLSVSYGINGYGGGGPSFPRALDFHFGDGSPDASFSYPGNVFSWNSPVHNYTQPGAYLMTLNATESGNGTTAYSFSETTVVVLGPGMPPAVVPDQLGGGTVYNATTGTDETEYAATVLGDNASNVSIWSFGDGSLPGIGNPVIHGYPPHTNGVAEYSVQYLCLLGAKTTVTSQMTTDAFPTSAVTPTSSPIDPWLVITVVAVAGDVGLAIALLATRGRRPAFRNPWKPS